MQNWLTGKEASSFVSFIIKNSSSNNLKFIKYLNKRVYIPDYYYNIIYIVLLAELSSLRLTFLPLANL